MIVMLAKCFQRKIFPRFLACKGMVFILVVCFQKGFSRLLAFRAYFLYWPYVSKKIVRVFRMYGHDWPCISRKKIVMVFRMYEHDCHIGHVFPEKVEALWAWLAYSRVFPEKIPYVLSLYGHVKHCHIDHGFQKKIKSYYQVSCKDIIGTLVMLFPDFSQVVSMYARGCHIDYVSRKYFHGF